MENPSKNNERDLYPVVERWLRPLLEAQFASVHLEITATKPFSDIIKDQIDSYRELIFSFLKDARPDLTGFVKGDRYPLREFIVVEVKNKPIKLRNIYQTRMYAELFDAHYALLLAPEIPNEIVRLSKVAVPNLFAIPYRQLTLVRFRDGGNSFEWINGDPFDKK